MKSVIVLMVCVALAVQLKAQQRYIVSHLDNNTGLSNNGVTGVFQDSDKLLWVNTWDGLAVYNGITFKSFKSNKAQPASNLPNNVITKVREDQAHRIWICTEEGITRYNKIDGSMNHYFYNKGRTSQKGKSADYMLTIGHQNNIVCGLRLDTVLYNYDTVSNRMLPIKFDQYSVGKIAKVDFDDANRLWTLSLGGKFSVFEKKGNVYHLLKSFEKNIQNFHWVNHRIFFSERDTKLWEITKDLKVRFLQNISHGVQDIGYSQGHYFVAWLYRGIQEYDQAFNPVDDVLRYCPILRNIEITSLTETDGKTLWVATSDRGIYKIQKQTDRFNLDKKAQGELITTSNVQAIHRIGDELWLGTRNNGIIRVPNSALKASVIQINPVSALFDKTYNSYYSFVTGYDNQLYIGSEAMGLTIYDPEQKKFTKWQEIEGAPADHHFFRVRSILPQKDTSLFAGYNGGVYHIKLKPKVNGGFKLVYAKQIRVDGHFLKPGNNQVCALADIGDHVLIGYRFAGLSLLNKKNCKAVNITAQIYEGSLANNNILTLYVDRKKCIWIGTSNGIFRAPVNELHKRQPRFVHFSNKNGLPNNIVHAIQEDLKGNIWVSTNQGLAKIDPYSFKIIQYNLEDGLQNAEFSDNASFRDVQGRLYFGGITGYNHFDPAQLTIDKTLSNLLITDFNIADKTSDDIQLMVIKPQGNEPPKQINLLRNENHFSFNVQPADGYTNRKFQYRCFLKGYDNKWRELSEMNRIEYTSLPSGNYDFFIKWSNGQGEWSSVRNIFQVEIRQYFWLSTTARVIYAFVLLAAVYAYYLFRKGKEQIKRKLAIENLIRVKEKKLYQEKMDFFTNITHELQTPLTLILGSIERFFFKNDGKELKQKGWNFLNVANQEAFRMQYLIHQLLEFRKAEAGHLGIQLTVFNISNLITGILALFEPIADQNNFILQARIADKIQVSNDKDKLEKIIFNLLSNAFKYTKPDGTIEVDLSQDADRGTLQLVVANSGYTGPEDNLGLLFEQFYTVDQANESKISSGIGLAFSKQLAELLGGTIAVQASGQWITFSVTLPLEVPASAGVYLADARSSEKPSYLLRSAVGSHLVPENRIDINNELALVENLSNQNKKTILVIEDEPSIRSLLREILQDHYIVYEADNGKAALHLLKKIIPSLIVSDVLMDSVDGLQLCKTVKNTIETCHVPFLLLSALATADERVEGFEAGADAYLTKPFSAPTLIHKIEQLIQYREKMHTYFTRDDYAQSLPASGLKVDDRDFLEKVLKTIKDHIDNPDIDPDFLEKAMAMSRMSFYRKIKGLTNMTPGELIKHVRLTHAAHLLRTTGLTVSEIYYQTGFNNQSYFYREFKRVYNYSPREFREQTNHSASAV